MKLKRKFFYIILSVFFYGCFPNSEIDKNKYQHYVGYIDQEKALLKSEYVLCDKENIKLTYNGAAAYAFKGTKKRFRDSILSKYNHTLYQDSGYVSFRFLVNCEGEAGWFEIVEMNLDLQEVDLNDKMVEELLKLTSEKQNWNKLGYRKDEKFDYYMYILYRIENGQITEILP
jgi:hypothetical protein|tara:strand:+ start:637 stop:1155 length:519 start_codon:yes stop_codon:yes gene_type:complete